MMRYGYDMRFATGVIAASGTITQLIPPSLVLVVLADQLGRSVGDMYKGASGPSILQVALFALYTFVLSALQARSTCPALPPEARTLDGWALWRKCLRGIIPSVVLIFLVLGSIFLRHRRRPTEAGAMGAVGALILARAAPAADLAADRARRWTATMRITGDGGLHPDRLDACSRSCSRASTAPLGRAPADQPARRASSAS